MCQFQSLIILIKMMKLDTIYIECKRYVELMYVIGESKNAEFINIVKFKFHSHYTIFCYTAVVVSI